MIETIDTMVYDFRLMRELKISSSWRRPMGLRNTANLGRLVVTRYRIHRRRRKIVYKSHGSFKVSTYLGAGTRVYMN